MAVTQQAYKLAINTDRINMLNYNKYHTAKKSVNLFCFVAVLSVLDMITFSILSSWLIGLQPAGISAPQVSR